MKKNNKAAIYNTAICEKQDLAFAAKMKRKRQMGRKDDLNYTQLILDDSSKYDQIFGEPATSSTSEKMPKKPKLNSFEKAREKYEQRKELEAQKLEEAKIEAEARSQKLKQTIKERKLRKRRLFARRPNGQPNLSQMLSNAVANL